MIDAIHRVTTTVTVQDRRPRIRRTPLPLGWDGAIEDCREQIAVAKRRIVMLEGCIKTFERLKVDGMKFPT